MTQSNPPAPASVPAAATESRSAAHGPTRKLTRAARDHAEKQLDFALAAGLAALHWIYRKSVPASSFYTS